MRALRFCPVSFFPLFSWPNLSGRRLDVYTWCGPSANLEYRSEVCCMRLAVNAGPTKNRKNSISAHHRTTLSGYIGKKLVRLKQQCLPHVFSQYGELRPTSRWYLLASLGHPSKFQRVSRLGNVTARHSSGHQPNFAALSRGRHLYSAERPSRWALAHILGQSVSSSLT